MISRAKLLYYFLCHSNQLVRKHRQTGQQMESSPASLMTYFAQQCKEHLHLVLAYSPLGSSLRDSVRYFPSLINCCTIDWFEVILNILS